MQTNNTTQKIIKQSKNKKPAESSKLSGKNWKREDKRKAWEFSN